MRGHQSLRTGCREQPHRHPELRRCCRRTKGTLPRQACVTLGPRSRPKRAMKRTGAITVRDSGRLLPRMASTIRYDSPAACRSSAIFWRRAFDSRKLITSVITLTNPIASTYIGRCMTCVAAAFLEHEVSGRSNGEACGRDEALRSLKSPANSSRSKNRLRSPSHTNCIVATAPRRADAA